MIEGFPEEVHRENLWERKPLIQYNTNDINLGYKWQNKQHKTNYVTRYNTKQYPHPAKHIQYPHPAKGNPHPTPPYSTSLQSGPKQKQLNAVSSLLEWVLKQLYEDDSLKFSLSEFQIFGHEKQIQ